MFLVKAVSLPSFFFILYYSLLTFLLLQNVVLLLKIERSSITAPL